MNRKIWSTEEKTAIVLEMIKGDESMAAICTGHGVSTSQAYRWPDLLQFHGVHLKLARRNISMRGRAAIRTHDDMLLNAESYVRSILRAFHRNE